MTYVCPPHTCTHMHTEAHTHKHMHIYIIHTYHITHIHHYIHTCTHTHIILYTYTHTHTSLYTHMYTYHIPNTHYTHTSFCTHAHTYIRHYTHTHTSDSNKLNINKTWGCLVIFLQCHATTEVKLGSEPKSVPSPQTRVSAKPDISKEMVIVSHPSPKHSKPNFSPYFLPLSVSPDLDSLSRFRLNSVPLFPWSMRSSALVRFLIFLIPNLLIQGECSPL